MKISVSPYPHQHLLSLLVFKVLDILVDVKCYIIVALICISLMTNDVEHIFIYFLAICISFGGKCLFKPFAHLKIELVIFLLLNCKSFLYILNT